MNTYPDVVVVCGQPQFTDMATDTLLNPIVIIEILSPSTERYDRGMKFQHYRMINTLQEYILVAQNDMHVECFSRQEAGLWIFQEALNATDILHIQSIECELVLEDVYEKVVFDTESTDITRDIPTEE